MWKQGEDQDIPNLDNHLAAVDRAKQELDNVQDTIKEALSQKADLISGNQQLLKEKLADLDAQGERLIALQQQAQELYTQNQEKEQELAHKSIVLEELTTSTTKNHEDNCKIIDNKSKDLDLREEALRDSVANHENNKLAVSEQSKINNNSLIAIESHSKNAQEFFDKVVAEQGNTRAYAEKAKADLEAVIALKTQIEAIQEDSNNKLSIAQQSLEESRINKSQTEDQLKQILSQKSTLNDLIIESKRQKMESLEAIDNAKNKLAETNLKIAELNILKEAMAKQEK